MLLLTQCTDGPFSKADGIKVCPSTRSPATAAKRYPSSIWRLSITTPWISCSRTSSGPKYCAWQALANCLTVKCLMFFTYLYFLRETARIHSQRSSKEKAKSLCFLRHRLVGGHAGKRVDFQCVVFHGDGIKHKIHPGIALDGDGSAGFFCMLLHPFGDF